MLAQFIRRAQRTPGYVITMPFPSTNGRSRSTPPEGHRADRPYPQNTPPQGQGQGLPRNGHIQGSRPYPAKEGSSGQDISVPRSSEMPSTSSRSFAQVQWATQQGPGSPRSPGRYIKNTRSQGALNGPLRSPPTSRANRGPVSLGPGHNPANAQWPESYGFSLAGDGPVYVIAVQRDSVAHKAGELID